jgi:hypothetical protein
MNLRRLALWACVFSALLIYVLAFEKPAVKQQKTPEPRGDYEKVFDLDIGAISSVTIAAAGKNAKIERRNLNWVVTEPPGARTLPEQCESMISAALDTVVLSVIDEKPADLTQYGLDRPGMIITLATGAGKQSTLKLGKKSPSDVSIYALDTARGRVVLVGTYIGFSARMFMDNIQ